MGRPQMTAEEVPEDNKLILSVGNQNWILKLDKVKESINNPDKLKYNLENYMR